MSLRYQDIADDDLYEITFEDEAEDEDDDDIVVDDEELVGLFEEAETHRQTGSQPTRSVFDSEGNTTRVQVPLSTLARLFGITSSTLTEEDEDENDDEYYAQPTTPPQPSWTQPHREPQEAGVRLLGGGEFGRVGPKLRSRQRRQRNVSRELEDRRMRLRPSPRELYAQELVPNSNGVAVASYEANIYCGQYSADSSFYYTCCQGACQPQGFSRRSLIFPQIFVFTCMTPHQCYHSTFRIMGHIRDVEVVISSWTPDMRPA